MISNRPTSVKRDLRWFQIDLLVSEETYFGFNARRWKRMEKEEEDKWEEEEDHLREGTSKR